MSEVKKWASDYGSFYPDPEGDWVPADVADDLYEALAEARSTIQCLIDDGYTGYVDLRTQIDAALAKARGESSND